MAYPCGPFFDAGPLAFGRAVVSNCMSHSLSTHPSVEELKAFLESLGGTDSNYMAGHFERYVQTKAEILRTWPTDKGRRMLDVGGHWLHQAALYAVDGFDVTSVDMAATFSIPHVQKQAETLGIKLMIESDLENPQAMPTLPENGFDLILFSEIIEHITFNPVQMWSVLYRLLAPGGRIVVTTPNFYALRGRCWEWKRFFSGNGAGLPVYLILGYHTYGHHWKEFSRKELIEYFYRLSPDFQCSKSLQMREFHDRQFGAPAKWLARRLEHYFPILRPNLHMEFDLPAKQQGIIAQPGWM
jgi:2-polyprenyl-6-hydroxyphenyl methylase/3-demethylubiquinone-9 3-methyltransferase